MRKRIIWMIGIALLIAASLMLIMPKYKQHVLKMQQEQTIEQAMGYALEHFERYLQDNSEYSRSMAACELHICMRMSAELNESSNINTISGVVNVLLADKEELLKEDSLEKGLELLSNDANSPSGYAWLLEFFNANTH